MPTSWAQKPVINGVKNSTYRGYNPKLPIYKAMYRDCLGAHNSIYNDLFGAHLVEHLCLQLEGSKMKERIGYLKPRTINAELSTWRIIPVSLSG